MCFFTAHGLYLLIFGILQPHRKSDGVANLESVAASGTWHARFVTRWVTCGTTGTTKPTRWPVGALLDLWDRPWYYVHFSLILFNTVLTWYIRTGIFSTNSPFFSPFLTSFVRIESRSLLGRWGRGEDWGEISGEDGADLREGIKNRIV